MFVSFHATMFCVEVTNVKQTKKKKEEKTHTHSRTEKALVIFQPTLHLVLLKKCVNKDDTDKIQS